MAEIKKYLDTAALSTLVDKIKSEDAKVLKEAKDYTDKASYDPAGSAATAESNAKSYADTQVAALSNGQVKLNKEAIEKLNGGVDVEGSVAKAVKDAQDTLQANIDSVDGKVDNNADAIAAINNAETGLLKQAKDYADGKVAVVQGKVDALEALVGELPEGDAKTVIEYVNAKTEGIATDAALEELQSAVDVVEGKVATIEGDYLKGADKTELEGKISAVQTAVDTEKSRAEGVESGLDARIKAVEDDYLKAADKTELQGNINTVSAAVERLTNGVSADEIDGVNDLIKYVNEHGTEVTSMQEDIAQNASDIDAVEGRLGTAEGKINTLEGAVATKVEQSVYDAKVGELVNADTAIKGRLDSLEAAIGESGSVAEDIATAKEEAIAAASTDATNKANQALVDAKAYTDTEVGKDRTRLDALEAIEHHNHSNKEVLDGISTEKVNGWDNAAAKAHEHANATVLNGITSEKVSSWDTVTSKAAQTDLDAAELLIAANDAAIKANQEAIALKASQEDLNALAEKVTTAEANIAANTSAINSFTPISSEDVNALFA